MEWIKTSERLPDTIKLGDGNVCNVKVKYRVAFNLPEEGECLFGNSGYPNEPNSFFTSRPVIMWAEILPPNN